MKDKIWGPKLQQFGRRSKLGQWLELYLRNRWGIKIAFVQPGVPDARPFMNYILAKQWPHKLVGAEIGVARGGNALEMCKHLPLQKLFLIDPYEPFEDSQDIPGPTYLSSRDIVECEKQAHELLKPYPFVEWSRGTSSAVMPMLPILDFVYIDGCHKTESVHKDIHLAWWAVREGGIISGHDIDLPSVFTGVARFALEHDCKVYAIGKDWMFTK